MDTYCDATLSTKPECSEEPPSVPAPRTAPPPFNKPSADVLIRTCDLVEFRVRSHILLEASPVFEAMLTQPQTSVHHPRVKLPPASPVLEIAEDSTTIEMLLRICYPIVNPDRCDVPLEDVESALRAAMKYEMELPTKVLADYIEFTIAPQSPLQAWAIACRLGLENIARAAAEASLGSPLDFASLGTMEGINAGHYYRLKEYHRKGGEVADDYQLLKSIIPSTPQEKAPDSSSPVPVPSFPDMPSADLICRSSDGVEFRVQKSLLSSASPEVLQSLKDAERARNAALEAGSSSSEDDEPLAMPRVQLAENSAVLAQLFSFYQLGRDSKLPRTINSMKNLADLIAATSKYRGCSLHAIALLSKHRLMLASANPLQAYCVSASRGLHTRARNAAGAVIDLPLLETTYIPELEQCPALAYDRLLSYRDARRDVAVSKLRDILHRVNVTDPEEESTTDPDTALGDESEASSTAHVPSTPSITSSTPSVTHASQPGSGTSPGHLSSLSQSIDTYESKSSWLSTYVASLCATAALHPDQIPRTTEEVFVAATLAGTAWCCQCQLLASDLRNLGQTLAMVWIELKCVKLKI